MFTSKLVVAGVALRAVADLLGNRPLQIVMRLADPTWENRVSAVDRLVPIQRKCDSSGDWQICNETA